MLTPFWKTFLWLKQLCDAKILIQRISSFSVPKITVLRHVYPGSKLHQTWQTRSVSTKTYRSLKGCGMGPWLVLVSPCFRENTVATCKIGSFLCSLDNLPQKNVIVLVFGNQISKWRSFEKRAIFDLLFTFSSHQGKVTKIPSARISNTYIHIFCSPYWLFLPYQFWKKIRIYQVRFLFGMSPGVDSYSRHFETINK